MAELRAAVIVDVVGSRQLADRAAAHAALIAAFARTEKFEPGLIAPTVGDEAQGSYATVAQALRATAFLRLTSEIDVRIGLGWGQHRALGDNQVDGSAWWSARAALNESERRQKSSQPTARSWFVSELADAYATNAYLLPAQAAGQPSFFIDASAINAYLLTRDHIISTMNEREKRLTIGMLMGHTQNELAEKENISQSAVSQSLRNSGARNLVESIELYG